MSQSRGMSMIETLTNVVVGLVLAILTQVLAFPVMGLSLRPREHLHLAAIFTCVSLARSYMLRRLFERLARRRS